MSYPPLTQRITPRRLPPRCALSAADWGVPSLPHSQPTAGRPASPWGTAFRIEGLEVSLNHAREIAVREELDAVGHYIEEAQGYLAQIRVLHEEALNEFSRAQGE